MLERQFYHYNDLEEFHAGMWAIVRGEQRKEYIEQAKALMQDWPRFGLAMQRALTSWPNSCAHNLTALASNRIAWLGHAGCCIETGSPEEATRCAWHKLTPREQDLANKAAAVVLDQWVRQNNREALLL